MALAPTSNRFERVWEIQLDAINLTIEQTGSGQNGRVVIPASALEGEGRVDIDSGVLPVVDAYRSAIKLANDLKLPIVVIDKDEIWRASWGELYEVDGEGDGG